MLGVSAKLHNTCSGIGPLEMCTVLAAGAIDAIFSLTEVLTSGYSVRSHRQDSTHIIIRWRHFPIDEYHREGAQPSESYRFYRV